MLGRMSASSAGKPVKGRGGARSGAGRPRLRLAQLVERRRFDAFNPRHRRALLEDELPAGMVPELRELAEAYRREAGSHGPAAASWIAQQFAALVKDPERDRRVREHVERLREQSRRARERSDRLPRRAPS